MVHAQQVIEVAMSIDCQHGLKTSVDKKLVQNLILPFAHIAGIDLTKPEFWRTSLQVIADRIDEFIAETSK
jgi:hypothetical protein